MIQKRVKVKPNSKQQSIKEETDGSLIIHLKSPPLDGIPTEDLGWASLRLLDAGH